MLLKFCERVFGVWDVWDFGVGEVGEILCGDFGCELKLGYEWEYVWCYVLVEEY